MRRRQIKQKVNEKIDRWAKSGHTQTHINEKMQKKKKNRQKIKCTGGNGLG